MGCNNFGYLQGSITITCQIKLCTDESIFSCGKSFSPFSLVRPVKIFVGGISQDTTELQLREYFSRYGKLSGSFLRFFYAWYHNRFWCCSVTSETFLVLMLELRCLFAVLFIFTVEILHCSLDQWFPTVSKYCVCTYLFIQQYQNNRMHIKINFVLEIATWWPTVRNPDDIADLLSSRSRLVSFKRRSLFTSRINSISLCYSIKTNYD